MLFKDIIRKKRDGGELTDDEIQIFVDGLATESLPAEQVSSLAMAICLNSIIPSLLSVKSSIWSVIHWAICCASE